MAAARPGASPPPSPPPLRVRFALAGKFDTSPGFFIGTGKKKKEEGETSPGQGTSLSLSLPPCHFTELLDFLLLLEMGQRNEPSCAPLPPCPAELELR